ncbi:MAG: TonB-dependent receptor [Xanthomonadales bacterium]|nr:TonB-dependent receptor [Xanthomonadales bacterium]
MHKGAANGTGPWSPILRAAALLGLAILYLSAPVQAEPFRNMTIEQALDRLEAEGLSILYSSDLIRPWMRVREEPDASHPGAILEQILAPYRLTLADGPDGTLMIVRLPGATETVGNGHLRGSIRHRSDGSPVGGAVLDLGGKHQVVTDSSGRFELRSLPPGRYSVSLDDKFLVLAEDYVAEVRGQATTELKLDVLEAAEPALEELVVNASRYELVAGSAASPRVMTAADLKIIPDLGDDPLRAVGRLPGTATSGFSAKVNLRGGEADETLVRFDDLRLYNPFHLKDFHSVFSTIDPSVVDGIHVYTGGFPVAFGDRMSGVIDIKPHPRGEPGRRELSLSLFNASAMAAGEFDGQGHWMLSARRGHLDQVLDIVNPRLGEPRYMDFYGRIGRQAGSDFHVSGNFLVFDDDVTLFDSDQEERARATYRDRYLWLRVDYQPGNQRNGSLILARSDIDSRRSGSADQSGVSEGFLEDDRRFTIHSLQTDWSYLLSDQALLQFGAEIRDSSGRYAYQEQVEFDLLFDAPGAWQAEQRSRDLQASPSGRHYGLYGNLRLEPLRRLTLDAGLRWDRETLSAAGQDQLSPRISMMVDVRPGTRLRASWGRFFQAQAISELQVSDGVVDYSRPQRSDHWVASLEHAADSFDLRFEVYRKAYRNLRPRYENLLNSFVLLPELKPDRVLVHPDRAIAEGAEFSLRGTRSEIMDWWISYSWSSVKDRWGSETFNRNWDRRHSLQGGLGWRTDRWDVGLAAAYHSGWPTTDVSLASSDPALAATGRRNGLRLGSHATLDARVARKFQLQNGSLEIFLELANILGRNNDCCVEYEFLSPEEEPDDDEDEVVLVPSLELEKVRDLPFFPSVGIVWRF